jgi:hypothetical protein
MHRGYRIVCVTPPGRRRYLEILASYLLDQPLVDEWAIWSQTDDPAEIEFLEALAATEQRVTIWPSLPPEDGAAPDSMAMYRRCVDPGAVYVRFDDDICWIEDGFLESFLDFRIAHPELFLVYPFVVNNAYCTFLMQMLGRTSLSHGQRFTTSPTDALGYADGLVAQRLHEALLSALAADRLDFVRVPVRALAGVCIPAHCMSWFGSRFAEFGGVVPTTDDEGWLGVDKPLQLEMANAIYGAKAVAHFATPPQREHLEHGTDLLDRYRRLAASRRTAQTSALAAAMR